MIFLLKFVFCNHWAKCVGVISAGCFIVDSQPRRAHYFAKQSIVCYTLLNTLSFAPLLLPKFSPATAGDIDCNLSFFHLPKDDKKAADIFSITDLKVSIKFLFLLHKTPPICIRRQKIRAISVAFIGSFFARILIPIIKFVVDFI